MPDDTTHVEMVRYNKGSDVLLNLLTLMTDGGGTIPRGLRYLGNIARNPIRFVKLLWPLGKAASTTTVVLVMQTDENYLELDYKSHAGGDWEAQYELQDPARSETGTGLYPHRQRGHQTPGR